MFTAVTENRVLNVFSYPFMFPIAPQNWGNCNHDFRHQEPVRRGIILVWISTQSSTVSIMFSMILRVSSRFFIIPIVSFQEYFGG